MNPDEIVSTRWTDKDGIKEIDSKNNDPVYGKLVTYKDGRVILTRYKRHSGRVATGDDPGIPDTQEGEPETLPPDKALKEAWDKEQAKSQTQTDQAERKVKSVTYDEQGRKITTYVDGSTSIEEKAPAAKPAVNPGQVSGVPNTPTIQVQQADGSYKTEPNPSYVPPKENVETQTIAGVVYERRGDKWVPAVGLPTDTSKAPNKYVEAKQDPNTGEWHGLTAQGQWEKITGGPGLKGPGAPVPASATGWNPDVSKPDLGFGPRKQEIAGMLESGVFGDPTLQTSVDKANALLKQDYDHATLITTNLSNIAQGEEKIYQGGITQRSADQTQANYRLQAAVGLLDDVTKDISTNADKMIFKGGGGGEIVVGALNEILEKTRLLAEQFGGLVTPATIQPGANMARTAPIYQPIDRPTPSEPPMPPVVQPGGEIQVPEPPVPAAPAAPFVPPPSGAPATAPPTQGPYAPAPGVAPPPPMSEQSRDRTGSDYPGSEPANRALDHPYIAPSEPSYVPGSEPRSITDRAQQARMLFGAQQPPPQVAPPVTPSVAAAASGSPMMQSLQGQPPTTGGTLSWARAMGFDKAIIDQWIAMQGQQPAA